MDIGHLLHHAAPAWMPLLRLPGGLVLALLGALVGPLLAGALPINDGESPSDPPPSCLDKVNATLSASPATVPLGHGTTLYWTVTQQGSCSYTLTLNGEPVAKSGSRVKTPLDTQVYQLSAYQPGRTRYWQVLVTVTLPPRDLYGRITVPITANTQSNLFIQAVGTRDTTVWIASGVELNLSGKEFIPIFPGVQILGTRSSANPGPRLYTTTFPPVLFSIGEHFEGTPERRSADNVRISGIRLEGAETGIADADTAGSTGIVVISSMNVEISNNEISRWRGTAVNVRDPRGRINRTNAGAVRIHDNFIHHNLHYREQGYGVAMHESAYALIERNVFDYNRHAITAEGSTATGYLAYRNLVLEGGGFNSGFPLYMNTHQIDVHGTESCWNFGLSCGVAGQYFDMRYNTILYTAGTAIKVRGAPTDRAEVTSNVFAHSDEWGSLFWDDAALVQTDGPNGYVEHNLYAWDNTFGLNTLGEAGWCDFDGDGGDDRFLATGATWWYASQGQGPWTYLNTSTKQLAEVSLGDVDGDGRCDVTADGMVSSGGTTPLQRLQTTDILVRNPALTPPLGMAHMENGRMVGNLSPVAMPSDWQVLGTGDFDGDGDSDMLSVKPGVGFGTVMISHLQDGVVVDEFSPGFLEPGMAVQGIADFDGDGAADILWRLADGSLLMWLRPKGPGPDVGDHATPSWRNAEGIVGADWQIKAVGDFNGDGYADIVWRHDNGQVAIWLMVGSLYTGEFYPGGPNPGLTWKIQGVGDFNGDGRADLLWRYDGGGLAIWFQGSDWSVAYPTWQNLPGANPGPEWQIQGVSDFNQDGRADILWRRTDGLGAIWLMHGGVFSGEPPTHFIDTTWQIQGLLPRE